MSKPGLIWWRCMKCWAKCPQPERQGLQSIQCPRCGERYEFELRGNDVIHHWTEDQTEWQLGQINKMLGCLLLCALAALILWATIEHLRR